MFWYGFIVGIIVTLILLPQIAKWLLPWFLKKKASKFMATVEAKMGKFGKTIKDALPKEKDLTPKPI